MKKASSLTTSSSIEEEHSQSKIIKGKKGKVGGRGGREWEGVAIALACLIYMGIV